MIGNQLEIRTQIQLQMELKDLWVSKNQPDLCFTRDLTVNSRLFALRHVQQLFLCRQLASVGLEAAI